MVYATELGVRINWDDSKIKPGMARTERDIKGFASSVRDSISQGIGQAFGQTAIQFATQAAKQVVGAMIATNAEFEDFNTQFKVMLGSAEEAKKFLTVMEDFAKRTPFEMSDLAKASSTLLAFGVNADKIMPTLRLIGDVSLGNKAKFDSLSLAFAQVQSTGRLMGMDLLQMVNQGFNPLQVISEKTGRSMADLKKDMEAGAISAQMVEDAFRIATSEGGRFFNGMEEGSKTFNGLMSTMRDAVSIIMREYGAPLFDAAKKGLIKVIDYISSDTGKAFIKNLIDMTAKAALFGAGLLGVVKVGSMLLQVSSGISGALITMAGNTGAMIGMSKGATMAAGAMGYLKAAVAAITGPIGIAVAVVTALGVAYSKNFAGFRDWVNSMVADVGAFVQEIVSYFNEFASENEDLVEFVRQYWENLKNWWATLFKVLMDVVSFAWETIKAVVRTGLGTVSELFKGWRALFQGDWEGAWNHFATAYNKVWSGIVSVAANAMATVLGIIDKFGDHIAKAFGMSFVGLDGAIDYLKKVKADADRTIGLGVKASAGAMPAMKSGGPSGSGPGGWDFSGFGSPTGGARTGRSSSSTAREADEITREMLRNIARSVRTPAGQASCAYFASEVLRQTGVEVKSTPGARDLVRAILEAGGREIDAGQAKAGDLVYYRGQGYGALRFNEGGQRVGYHVGIYDGEGKVIDSSGGRTRLDRRLGGDARFVRPARSGRYGNEKETAVHEIEAFNDALEREMALLRDHSDAMNDLWREQVRLGGARRSEIFEAERLRGLLPELTEERYQEQLAAIKSNEALEDRRATMDLLSREFQAANQTAKDYLDQASREIALGEDLTEVQRALWEIENGRFATLNVYQRAAVLAAAERLDATRKERVALKAYSDAMEEVRVGMAALGATSRESGIAALVRQGMSQSQASEVWDNQQILRGMTAYTERIRDLAAAERELAIGTREAAIQQMMTRDAMTREQALEIVGTEERIRATKAYREAAGELAGQLAELTGVSRAYRVSQLALETGMTASQASQIVARKEALQQLKELRDSMRDASQTVADVFMEALGKMGEGVRGFFDSLVSGFRRALQQMAAEYIRNQVFRSVFGWMENLGRGKSSSLASAAGGSYAPNLGGFIMSAFGGMRAAGGPVSANMAYLVGENGPELVVPRHNATVYNAGDTSRIVGGIKQGGSTVINLGGITINGARDYESFRRNEGQLAADLHRLLNRASRRNS